MPQQQPQQQGQGPDGSILFKSLIKGIISGFCLTIEAFIHRSFGRYYITSGFAGVLVIFGFLAFFPDDNQTPLICFLAAYAVVWLVGMIAMGIRCWRGPDTLHSSYTGDPYVRRLLPTMKEETVKTLESLTVFGVGFWVACLNRPLGDYLMLASTLMFLRGVLLVSRLRAEATEMNDMMIEQKIVAARVRDMQGR
jgi:hypothetical protein